MFTEGQIKEELWKKLHTNNRTVVFSDPALELQSAGEESTRIVSLWRFGKIWRPDISSQANATGGKQRSLHSPGLPRKQNRVDVSLLPSLSFYIMSTSTIKSAGNTWEIVSSLSNEMYKARAGKSQVRTSNCQ